MLCFREAAEAVNGYRLVRRNGECATYMSTAAERPAQTGATDWGRKARNYTAALGDDRLAALATELHVSRDALKRIGAGWHKHLHCYTFPERDATGRVTGVGTRRPADGEKKCLRGSKRGLILPPELDPALPLLIVEGASDTAAALTIGVQAVGRPSARGGVAHLVELLERWTGDVLIVGERDQKPNGDWPGRDGAVMVAGALARRLGRPIPCALPPEGAKDLREWTAREAPDLADAEACRGAGERILAALREAAETIAPDAERDDADSGDGGGMAKKSQSSKLLELFDGLAKRTHCTGARCAELWHAGDAAYATVAVAEHVETWLLRSKGFRRWLSREFHRAEGRAPSAQPMQDALCVIEGRAIFDGPERDVFVRVGHAGDALYLDLGDTRWHCVEVTGDGWRVIPGAEAPVRFRRPRGMLALPEPERGGTLAELRRFIHVADDDAFTLISAWLIGALQPRGPYPILALNGEQGSGKSFTARALRRLIDPNEAELRSEPRDERDLVIAGNNGWTVALDNLSHVPPWLSDALCRIATGGGFATRELYSDDEERIFAAQRPILLNGIEEYATRPDLLDRAILVALPPIPETDRRDEATLWRAFDAARPKLLGALLSAVSAALRECHLVALDRLPRMADFARWVCGAEQGGGAPWEPGAFSEAYAGNRAAAVDSAIEAAPIGPALLGWLDGRAAWTGTAADLLAELDRAADERTKRSRGWPASSRAMSCALRRLAPSLRAKGVEVTFGERGGGRGRARLIRVDRAGETPSASSAPSETLFSGPKTPVAADGRGR